MILQPHAALMAIDVQKGFDLEPWGDRNNPGMESNGRALLAAWRSAGRLLLHARHDSVDASSPLRPGQLGNAFKDGFEPLAGEPIIAKTVNSAFIGTDLERRLREAMVRQLVLFGIATDMCVSTTARMAANLGFQTFVVGDACHTWAQTSADDQVVSGEMMHLANLTTLHNEFARVVTTEEVIVATAIRQAS